MFDGRREWKAKYPVDNKWYTICYTSLDVGFLMDTIMRCRRKHNKSVELPKGSVAKQSQSAAIQLPQTLPREPGSVPGDLYNANAFCQRHSFLLAFRHEFSFEQISKFIQQTPYPAYVDETFADIMRRYMGVRTVVRDDLLITTEVGFKSILMAAGTSWILSPVSVGGYTGHSVIVSGNHWFDSAHECAKVGKGVDMRIADWPSTIPYDWKHWNCMKLRQLIMPGHHGYTCACGVRVNREADAAVHDMTKRHKKWARWRSLNPH